jgi:hypothetical protein
MKKLILFSLLIFAAFQMNAQLLDTTISYYNFNGLNNGNLNNQDNWKTTLSGTTIDVQVASAYSHDGTNALHFTQNGGGVNASGNRPLDTIFPNFSYGDSAVYYLYFDLKIEWWGSQFGLAYDQNNDGKVNMNQNNEKGFRFVPAANSNLGTKLYNAAGTSYTSVAPIGSGWQRIEIKLEPYANNGHGYISIRSRSVSATTWTTLFSGINLGLDTTTATAKNPALWDQVFFHFTGSGSGLDNLEFWRIAEPPNNPPTDIILTSDTIRENQPSHTFIGYFRALDPDTANTHTFMFTAGAGDSDNGDFMILDSTLWSSILFDYEDTSMKYIRVKTVDNKGGSFEKAFVIHILDVNETNPGFELISEGQISIFPNPASDIIFIKTEDALRIKQIQLFGMDGSLLMEKTAEQEKAELNISGLASGSYLLIIESTDGKKLMKKIQIAH